MFLKYPKEVISISTSYINSPSQISVIRKSTSNNKKYILEQFLSTSDIAHTTEIYTSFGRFKILEMNNNLYLQCELRKATLSKPTMNRKEYSPHSCVLVSSELNDTNKNYLSILSILDKLRQEYFNALYFDLNKKFRLSLSNSIVSLKSSLELYNILSTDPSLDFVLNTPNITLLHKILDLSQSFSEKATLDRL